MTYPGMSQFAVADELPPKRRPTIIARRPIASPPHTGSGVQTALACDGSASLPRYPTEQTGHPAQILRKKLPWLDGAQTSQSRRLPGNYETMEDLVIESHHNGDATISPPPGSHDASGGSNRLPESSTATATATADAPLRSMTGDLALRAVGSEPIVPTRQKFQTSGSLSLNFDTRPGMKTPRSKKHARHILQSTAGSAESSPSEYSTTISTDRESLPARLPKRDHASYERLVQHTAARKATYHDPLQDVGEQRLSLVASQDVGHNSVRRRCRASCSSCSSDAEAIAALAQRQRSVVSAPRRSMAVPQFITGDAPTSPPRRQTLHPMPTHLVSSSSSSSPPTRRGTESRDALIIPGVSPRSTLKASVPAADNPRLQKQSRSLNRAVTGLNNLMEEALTVAKDAARSDRPDEVAHVLNSATMALRKASTTFPSSDGRMSKPLVLSPRQSGRDTDSDSAVSPNRSPSHSRSISAETAPTTVYSRSARSSRQPLSDPLFSNIPIDKRLRSVASSENDSISPTPPRMIQAQSKEFIVRDFAYAKALNAKAQSAKSLSSPSGLGAAADFYGDHGESVREQPGLRRSIALGTSTNKPLLERPLPERPLPELPAVAYQGARNRIRRRANLPDSHRRFTGGNLRELEHAPTDAVPPLKRTPSTTYDNNPDSILKRRSHHRPHVSDFFEYRHNEQERDVARTLSTVTDSRSVPSPSDFAKDSETENFASIVAAVKLGSSPPTTSV